MFGVSLLGLAILAADPVAKPDPADIQGAYTRAAAKAGRDADAHARLALWCEANGLTAERTRHLALAVMTDPAHALARGLLGLVHDGGKWRSADDVAGRIQADPVMTRALEEYRARRAASAPTADSQWKLALWCESRGLKDEAQAHMMAVLRIDPKREEAWRHLGYKKHEGVWRTDEQIAALKAEADAQRKADKSWRPRLEKWKAALDQPGPRRDQAEAALAAITDPRAVPMIVQVFARSHPARAAQVLGQIDSPGAAKSLAALAVFSPDATARRIATETLRHYDPREFADLLIGLVRDPIPYEVKPVGGPGSPGELLVAGKKFDVRRLYTPLPYPTLQPGDQFAGYDENGLPMVSRSTGRVRQTGMLPIAELFPEWFPLPQWAQGLSRGGHSLLSLPAPEMPGLPAAQNNALNQALGQPGADALRQAFAQTPYRKFLVPASDGVSDYTGALSPSYGVIAPNGSFLPPDPVYPYAAMAAGAQWTSLANITIEQRVRANIGQMARDAEASAIAAQQRLEADVRAIETFNAPIHAMNDRVVPVLQVVTGLDLGAKRRAWENWWADQLGYAQRQEPRYRPTVVEEVPIPFQSQPRLDVVEVPIHVDRISCFGAGTLVRTLDGPKPIESIEVGDRVLSQDTSTGALSFQPVLVTHHNPPSATLQVKLEDGEAILASTFHRFWLAGEGWRMARDLKPGDRLRTLNGTVRVAAVEAADVQPVFNLDVAGGHSFFVGKDATLVHDNSVPSTRIEPFDAHPTLAASE
jgi:hypothetical protein